MSIQINALKNVGAVVETAQILVKQNGLLGLALLPFCHVEFVRQEDMQHTDTYRYHHVVVSRGELPKKATIIRELNDEQLASETLVGNHVAGWFAFVHIDVGSVSTIGELPVKFKAIPDSIGLTKEQALERANKLFKGK